MDRIPGTWYDIFIIGIVWTAVWSEWGSPSFGMGNFFDRTKEAA